MNRNRLRFLLVDKLERELQIHLENKQLDYLFNNDTVLLFLTPRKYGKDMLTAMRIAIKMIEQPGVRIGVAIPTLNMAGMLQEKVNSMLEILLREFPVDLIESNTKNPCRIQLSTRSMVYFLPARDFQYNMCGHKFNETYIMEPTCIKNAKEVYELMSCARLEDENGKTIVISTPSPRCGLLDDLMRNNYATKIHVTRSHSPMLMRTDVTDFRNQLDNTTYRNEILGEYDYN